VLSAPAPPAQHLVPERKRDSAASRRQLIYRPSRMPRSPLRGAVTALVLGAGVFFAPRDAHAADPTSRLHLSYEAPPGCPSRRDFVALLSPRIQESWIDGADTRSFEVRVVREGASFAGELVIRQAGTPPNIRAIRGGSCKAVTTSLVVFLAIALDPISEQTSTTEAEAAHEAEEHEPEAAPRAEIEPRMGEVAPPQAPAPKPRVSVKPSPRLAPSSVAWTWSAGAAAAHLRAPEPSWGGRVHAELSRAGDIDPIALALRLSWGWSDFSTTPERAGEVHFRLKTARVEAGARASMGPCFLGAYLGMDVGSLTGRAADLPRFQVVTAPWTAWTAGVRGAVAVTPWLAVELAATLLVPFERPRFDLRDPPRLAYASPAVVFESSAGLAAVARFR